MVTLSSYLFISFLLFAAGIAVMIARKNIIAILLGVELLMNAAALNFANHNLDGHIISLFIIVIAAAESAVALAIAIRFFQIKDSIHVDDATQLQG
jgi:NADH:ubiquinone oxidoreductase subunit K